MNHTMEVFNDSKSWTTASSREHYATIDGRCNTDRVSARKEGKDRYQRNQSCPRS